MAGRASRRDCISAYNLLDEQGKQGIEDDIQESSGFEELAECTISRREQVRGDLEEFWANEDLLLKWLTIKVKLTKPSPRRPNATHVGYTTLKGWRMSIVRVVSKYVEDGKKKLNDGVYDRIVQHTSWLTVTYKLEVLQPDKIYCGRNEVRLLTEEIYASAAIQNDVVLKILFMTGVRPGAIGPASPRYETEGRFLKWKHINIQVQAYATYLTRIDFTALKGYNMIAAKRHSSSIRSCTRPDNVVFDIAPPLLSLAALLESKEAVIEWEDWFLEEPVALRGKIGRHAGCQAGVPLRSRGVTDNLQTIGKKINFPAIRAYDFRRNYGDEIDRTYGESGARTGLSHSDNSNTYNNNYSRGAANHDSAGAVLGEQLVDRRVLHETRGPALQMNVGLSGTSARSLTELKLQHTAIRQGQQPVVVKRTAAALITPSSGPPAELTSTQPADDATCRQHPLWLEFTSSTLYVQREQTISHLLQTVNNALISIPDPSMRPRNVRASTIKERLTTYYPSNPQLVLDQAEWKQLTGVHQAVSRRKLAAIRKLLGAGEAKPVVASEEGSYVTTYDDMQKRMAQFAAPSALIDAAIQHADLGLGTSSAPDIEQVRQEVNVDDLVDPEFIEFEEGPQDEVDVDEVPAWVIRAGYMRMISGCGHKEADRTFEWTLYNLNKHRGHFHKVKNQAWRWKELHNACFICAIDGEIHKFTSQSSYNRHMNPIKGAHSGDARLKTNKPSKPAPAKMDLVVRLPTTFISRTVAERYDTVLSAIFQSIEVPPCFSVPRHVELRDDPMQDARVRSEYFWNPPPLEQLVNTLAIKRSAKRIRVSKYAFRFVGDALE
ncbi:hypothetical protein B0H10DRAFT_2216781 [Mycena sp. CBHHK59/15]|nr:hypothetical protein B0H10DRAFT_2216781 [Mycena sp. CBHHK59/15]